VRCFGQSGSGQLGYGNVEPIGDDETPDAAGDVAVGGPVQQLAAGAEHTCAVLRSGEVRCWGKNERYQLGYSVASNDIGDNELPASAGDVTVGVRATQVAAGFSHTCALLVTGNVRCWGSSGALGYPGVAKVGDDETPSLAGDVDVGGKVTQIVAGARHTCALLESGSVRCWGSAANGMLGYAGRFDPIGDDETPASAGDVDVGGKVVQLDAGDYATCALLESGRVRCWGSGELGELGYGNTEDIGDDETPASAGDVDIGGLATRIDVGFRHVCATLESGAVRCWGRGGTAALGYGNVLDVGDDETPASVGDVQFF
jgi:alpha-tubulin suppressor-like RCC1 family protein